MSEYPEDIMKAAREVARSSVERPYNQGTAEKATLNIAAAILAERQRSASTARSWGETCRRVGQAEGASVADDIAQCIAEGK